MAMGVRGWQIRKLGPALGAAVALWLTASPVLAQTSQKDVLVALRTFSFLMDPPMGPTPVAVIFDPDNPRSVADAHALEQAIATAGRIGSTQPVAQPVPVTDLGRLGGTTRFAFLTTGLAPHLERVWTETRTRRILSVSTDLGCVRAGRCIMAVASEPVVRVVVSRAALAETGISFLTAFRMMIEDM